MSRLTFKAQVIALLALFVVLCMPSVNAEAPGQDQETWPVTARLLLTDDWVLDSTEPPAVVGDVVFTNGNENLQITVVPFDPYRIAVVHIHVVRSPDDFDSVLDSKGKPKPNKFDYKTDYVADDGIPAESHSQVIPLDGFDICWAPDPETCPPNFYAIVHVELQEPDKKKWVDVPGAGWADDGGLLMRTDKHDDRILGWHSIYPIAKVEPGHFYDAIVGGLGYVTITQYGVTPIVTNDGVTGEGGQFWFIPGERIAFYVGSLFIGETLADRRISPMDLFEADMDDNQVVNVARLLQSLDTDSVNDRGAINITEPAIACLEFALPEFGPPDREVTGDFFDNDAAVEALINATVGACGGALTAVSYEDAKANLNSGMQAGNLMKRNISKTPGLKSDKAKIEIMPVYVPAQRPDGSATEVAYHDAEGNVIEERGAAKPIVVSYLDAIQPSGAFDVFVAISRDDGDTWKRRNLSKTAAQSSLLGYPGHSEKPMLKVKDNMIFVAWTDKYCRGGRPGYAITVCPDTTGDGLPDPCEVCRGNGDEEVCSLDYPGDDAYWQDDIFGVGGPQRTVIHEDYPDMGEVPYSCVWTARGVIEPSTGDIQWFKPERLTSGRRDAYQLFAGAGEDVAFAIVWQEDSKGLMPGEGDGPGDGWSGANTHSKTDIWYSYITLEDFGKIDDSYPAGGFGDGDVVDTDSELQGRVKALVPMSLPVKISDNDVCSLENIAAEGGQGDHDYDGEGEGTHRYCGSLDGIGTAAFPGSNPLCAYTVEKANPKGEIHNVCVTADGRLLDGNTGASRANIFLQPYKKPDGSKSAYAIIGYEESKGVGSPPEDEDGCGDGEDVEIDHEDEDRYKPDVGKNVIYHSFDFANPQVVGGGGIINLPETDADGNPVYLVDEFGDPLLDWKGEPQLAYENARRIRFVTQQKSKAGASKTVLVALYRQGEEGGGKPADIFMRRMKASPSGNPYAFGNFQPGAQNVSSVEPTVMWQDPFDSEKPVKMLRWDWSHDNLADSSAKNPYTDARAHRGALNGDDLLIGYTLTPNWGRRANDKYDFFVRRSFNGGQSWTTDPNDPENIEHNVVFRVPIEDPDTQTVSWDEEVVTTVYGPGQAEPPRNVSNLRNNRTSVFEPRLVKTPGTILTDGVALYPEDEWDKRVYQLAYGLEFNQNQSPNDVEYPKTPLDIFYSQTRDKGQRYQSVIVTPQGGNGRPEEGWNPLAQDKPEQGAVQLRQTPDGSRMYGIWLEEGEGGSDIMFRRVDYR